MNLGTRTKLAKKLSGFLKTAQEEKIVPDIEDPLVEEEEEEEETEEEEEEKEDEEEEEEKDIEEKVEDIEEKVEDIEEQLESVVDALENQKEFIEMSLLDEEGMEEKLEDFKETEEEEVEEEEYSPEELGIEIESQNDKEDEMNVVDLRKARKARLRKRGYTLSEQWNEPGTTKKKFGPFSPQVTVTKVKKGEVPGMLKLSELSLKRKADKSAWIVLDGEDNPLFEIPRGDVPVEDFTAKEFAEEVIKEMSKKGIASVLKKYNAKSLRKVSRQANVEEKTAAKRDLSDLKRRFVRAFRLSLNAMNKNLVKPNPLKAAFFQVLNDLNVDNPEKIIEYAFAKGGTAHFETALAQTDKYMEMSDEAFIETEDMIGEAEVITPDVVEVDNDMTSEGIKASKSEELRRRANRNSLVLSTQSDSSMDSDRMEQLQRVLPVPKLFQARAGNQ